MDKRYDLRKIGIRHEQEDLDSYEAATLMIKEIERLRKVLEHVSCMCLGQCVHGVKDRERCIRYTARAALKESE